MVITGDVAIAHGDRFFFNGFPKALRKLPWCVNLEGAAATDGEEPQWGTYNTVNWSRSFSGVNLGPVCIANNHIHDLTDGVRRTEAHLLDLGLASVGAGCDQTSAMRGARCDSSNGSYLVLAFGWPVIGCCPATAQCAGVARLEGRTVRKQVEEVAAGTARKVVVLLHGNYEFERYPQPGHRDLSRHLIDRGAYAVVWHHPHIVGPVERYKGRTIAYSLGNWAFSYARFFRGRLIFPASTFHQIALELGNDGDVIHHARFEPPATVYYERSELVRGDGLSLRAGFEGLDPKAYEAWFRKHRLKRKGLPVYKSADDNIGTYLRDRWVRSRQFLVDAAAKAGLKRTRRGT